MKKKKKNEFKKLRFRADEFELVKNSSAEWRDGVKSSAAEQGPKIAAGGSRELRN